MATNSSFSVKEGTLPIAPPDWVYPSVRQAMADNGVEFCYNKNPKETRIFGHFFDALKYADGDEDYANTLDFIGFIEIPKNIGNIYLANCAVLHEIARINSPVIELGTAKGKEKRRWKHAEKLKNKYSFPDFCPETGFTFNEVKDFVLSNM